MLLHAFCGMMWGFFGNDVGFCSSVLGSLKPLPVAANDEQNTQHEPSKSMKEKSCSRAERVLTGVLTWLRACTDCFAVHPLLKGMTEKNNRLNKHVSASGWSPNA